MLHSLKIIPRDYISLLSAGNLTAEYESQTKKRTADAVTDALGGVFFLDEAVYILVENLEFLNFNCFYCMITRARARSMAAEGHSFVPLKKFTGYNDVAPAVWLEKYAICANSKGWNAQQTLSNMGLYLGDGHIHYIANYLKPQKITCNCFRAISMISTCNTKA